MIRYIIFVCLFLISCASSLYGQIERVVKCETESITFKAEMLDYNYLISRDTSLYYHIGDTVELKYIIMNNSVRSVYIFDPKQFYWDCSREPHWDSSFCRYIYKHLGGSWFYKPGYDPMLMLIQLNPSSKYEYTFKFVLLEDKYKDDCMIGINKSRDKENTITNLIFFDIGYVFESDSIKLTDKDEKGYVNFPDQKRGFYFDFNLRRFYLGPLMFRMRK